MPDCKRFNPVIDGYKECSQCKESKKLEESYYFHKSTGYYYGRCISCCQENRRLQRPVLFGRRENSIYIRQKVCIKCNIEKDLNKDNFGRGAGKYSNICRICKEIEKTENKNKKRNIGHLSDDDKRVCIKCQEEKCIIDFSYSKNIGYYSSYCKSCDVIRKQEKKRSLSKEEMEIVLAKGRQWHKDNRSKSSLTKYKKFDSNKGLELDITEEFLYQELQKSCTYCGFPSTGLDRKDNSLGHTIDNCVPCCWECNTARMNNFTFEETKILGQAIKEIKENRFSSALLDSVNNLLKSL